ncbi:MAG: TetR/AcrR family transcriptional regulator [Flavitalea sp.]
MSKSETTKAYIIEKIAPVFNRQGYSGTSLNDMTRVTGLTKGSIYGNFLNKDEVAVAAFDHNLGRVSEMILTAMEEATTTRGKLLAMTHVYAQFGQFPFPEGGCPILNTAIEADDTHPVLREKAVVAINSLKNRITRLIRTGIKNKEFRSSTDAGQAALLLLATIEGGIMIARLTGKKSDRQAILQSIDKMIHEM